MSLAAVVLAGGSARRFGSDKLSADFHGEPLVFHAIRAARAAPVARVIVVAHPRLDTGEWIGEPEVEVVRLTSAALSESLRTGLNAAGAVEGVFVFLGDMPLVPADAAGRLARQLGNAYAALPVYDGKPGHPVLLSARAIQDAEQLEGDFGAGKLLRGRDDVVRLEWSDVRVLADVDRPEDLRSLSSR